jgi:O-antigen/teichoic acid export membrane protein
VNGNASRASIGRRVIRAVFWSLLGTVMARAVSLAGTIVVARALGAEGFGEFGMIQSTVGMFGVFAGFGLGATTAKHVAEFRASAPSRAGAVLGLTTLAAMGSGILVAAICIVFGPWLAGSLLGNEGLAGLIQLSAIQLVLLAVSGVFASALSGFEAFPRVAFLNVVQGLLTPLAMAPAAVAFGLHGAVVAMIAASACELLLAAALLRSECRRSGVPWRPHASMWSERRVIWNFALPSLLSAMLVSPVIWIGNAMLANQPAGYRELGLFNSANQWRGLVMFIPGAVTAAILPVLAETYGRRADGLFRDAMRMNLQAAWLVALPMAVIVICWSRELSLLFGKSFAGAERMTALLMIAAFMNIINAPVGAALAASGRMWTGAAMNLGWGAALVAASYVLIPSSFGLGLAAAYAIAYFLHNIWVMAYVELRLARGSLLPQLPIAAYSALILAGSMVSVFGSADSVVLKLGLALAGSLPVVLYGARLLATRRARR